MLEGLICPGKCKLTDGGGGGGVASTTNNENIQYFLYTWTSIVHMLSNIQ